MEMAMTLRRDVVSDTFNSTNAALRHGDAPACKGQRGGNHSRNTRQQDAAQLDLALLRHLQNPQHRQRNTKEQQVT